MISSALSWLLLLVAISCSKVSCGKVVSSFGDVPPSCQNSTTNLAKGEYAFLTSKTDISNYDLFKRPNTAVINDGPQKGRPVTTTPDQVQVMIELKSVQTLNPIDQSMELSIREYIRWNDVRLTFNLSTDELCMIGDGDRDVEKLSLRERDFVGKDRLIWVPDTYISNKITDNTNKQTASVFYNGTIERYTSKTIRTKCEMDFAKFPFDEQICEVSYKTFGQSQQEVDISPGCC
jgi:hypothetical protein